MRRKIWDFHGGIHPPENKVQSTRVALEKGPLPDYLAIPLQQHLGVAAKPLVKVGDSVLKGQKIAAAAGYMSVPVHAPTSGVVIDISNRPIPHPSGLSDLCVVIEPDGKEQWIEHEGVDDYTRMDKSDLLAMISDAGIAGMGGAGFPAAVKLNPSANVEIDHVILNAVECEPYITADDMLIRKHTEEVIQGLQIIKHILQPSICSIGIEDNKPEAIAALREVIDWLGLSQQIELVVVPTKYPSGGEKQLIRRLTGLEVPSGGIPADIGVLCQNVSTAAAIYRAVCLGEPLISRVTTVTGKAIRRPRNMEVLIGTPIQALLEQCDVQAEVIHRLIMGGPMMGFSLPGTDMPITKTSNCIMAVTREELPPPPPEQNCIRCGKCALACPSSLLPQQLYWFSRSQEFEKALAHNLLDCIECGACAYVCPSNIPLVQYYRFAKGEIRAQEHEHTKSEQSKQRFERRKARLEKELAEKEAKRKARKAKTQKTATAPELNSEASSNDDGVAKAVEV